MISGIQAEVVQKLLINHPNIQLVRVDKQVQILVDGQLHLVADCTNDVLKFIWPYIDTSVIYRKGNYRITLAKKDFFGAANYSLLLEKCPDNNKSSLAYTPIANLLYGSINTQSLGLPNGRQFTLNEGWLGQVELMLRKFNALHVQFEAINLYSLQPPVLPVEIVHL